ncbi:hypothetical protein A2U01_0114027, partial [Trifolium medium]|nr:hypothetical protein [Trifolium medium]
MAAICGWPCLAPQSPTKPVAGS